MDGDGRFNRDPFEMLGTLGPPTRFQPQWQGVGYKSYVFESSPVTHVITPDHNHHQAIRVDPANAHLPVERELLGYIADTGYNPAQFHIPEHQTAWDYISEAFGFPDSRPASTGQQLPRQARQQFGYETDAEPFRVQQPRIRDASESSLPYRPRWND